jgi:TolB-like protein
MRQQVTRDEKSSQFRPRRSPAECVSIRDVAERIPEELCRRHLEKVTGSVTFGRAEQLRHLLKWLAERSLEAQRTAPSEKEIAAAVLNRKDFDPQTDSLVRKEMSRLREKLSRYYMSEGLHDEIRINAGGGYVPGFERRGNANPAGGKSCWLVLPFRSSTEMVEDGDQFLEELLFALGEPGGRELVAATTALGYRGRAGDVREFASECHADFVVEGSLRRRNEVFEVTAWLIDGQSGRATRSKRIAGSNAVDLARLVSAWLLEDEPE